MDKNLAFRIADNYIDADGYGKATPTNGAGALTFSGSTAVVLNTVDLGAAGQIPWEDLQLVANFPQNLVFAGTAAATAYALQFKLEFADTGTPGTTTLGTVVYTQTFQSISFANASNAAKFGTINSVNFNLPNEVKATVPNVPHRYCRVTITPTPTGGTAPTLAVGNMNVWLDIQAEDHPYALVRMD